MSDNTKGKLTITYMDGTEQKFTYDRKGDEYTTGGQIKEAMKQRMLILDLEDRALFIPYDSIKSIEVSPKPVKLPSLSLENVRQIN